MGRYRFLRSWTRECSARLRYIVAVLRPCKDMVTLCGSLPAPRSLAIDFGASSRFDNGSGAFGIGCLEWKSWTCVATPFNRKEEPGAQINQYGVVQETHSSMWQTEEIRESGRLGGFSRTFTLAFVHSHVTWRQELRRYCAIQQMGGDGKLRQLENRVEII